MIELAVIADDLTGAADTAIRFRHIGAPILLVSNRNLASSGLKATGGILTVSTDSRHLPAAKAATRARQSGRAIKKLAPRVIYKKIDSCLRGNIGAEVDALMDVLGYDRAFIAPAFPAQGRTTLHGIQFVRGVPVGASEMARDPVSPINESRVSELVNSQSRYAVGRIDLAEIDAGLERLQEVTDSLLRQGRRLIIFDAVTQRHLDLIASLARNHFPGTMLTGSAGLALALAHCLPAGGKPPIEPGFSAGQQVLFVCGSGSEVLKGQVEALVQQAGATRHVLDPTLPVGECNAIAGAKGVPAAGAVILQLAPVAAEDSRVSPDQAASALAAVAAAAIRHHRPDALFLCGGDTATHLLEAIKATGVWLQSEILPGVVRGKIRGGDCDGLAVVTKPGAFGDPDTLLRLYAILTGNALIDE